MEWNWLHSLVFGLLSGFAEFLPVSADAHQFIFSYVTGAGNELLGFRLICHISVLAILFFCCRTQLRRLSRERRIAATSPKRRRRQPDKLALMDLRVLRTSSVPMLLGFILFTKTQHFTDRLWVLALLWLGNGLILFLPQFCRSGNKTSQGMSAIDSLLIGVFGALAVIPGISRIGALISGGKLRGAEGHYTADIALLLCIPALIVLIGFDIYAIYLAQSVLSFSLLLHYILAAVAAGAGAFFGILLLRFLAVKIGFAGFSYYCWGAALLTFALYLTI